MSDEVPQDRVKTIPPPKTLPPPPQRPEYFQSLASLYDTKASGGLNALLAETDLVMFNHNGILLPSEEIATYRKRITSEEVRLEILHELEKNTVRFGRMYLGSPTSSSLGLDAGCGGGGGSILISREFGSQMEGFTLSPGQAEFATRAAAALGYGDRLKFATKNMLKLDVEDNRYDFVWACESTEHAPDLDVMFSGWFRIAKPSARLVITAWSGQQGIHPDGKRTKKLIDEHYLTGIHTPEQYVQAGVAAGWRKITTVDITEPTAAYWQLRAESSNRTGAEEFMTPGFTNRAVLYMVYVFEKP